MFTLNNIQHRYDGKEILSIQDWQVAQGEHWLLLGPSGSGKTTLLYILAGLLTPSAGKIKIAHQEFGQLAPRKLDLFRGQHIGIVPQKLHLIDSLTVFDNLLLAQYSANLQQDKKRAEEVLTSLNLVDKAYRYPNELSHGEAQRVALARAIINKPQLILADEPTSNLDDQHCNQVLDLLKNRAQECNATLLIATHDQRIKQRITKQYELRKSS